MQHLHCWIDHNVWCRIEWRNEMICGVDAGFITYLKIKGCKTINLEFKPNSFIDQLGKLELPSLCIV